VTAVQSYKMVTLSPAAAAAVAVDALAADANDNRGHFFLKLVELGERETKGVMSESESESERESERARARLAARLDRLEASFFGGGFGLGLCCERNGAARHGNMLSLYPRKRFPCSGRCRESVFDRENALRS
jgi:hypothetical protein